jgi:hypothetical protein
VDITSGPFHPLGFIPNLLLGMAFRAEGRARLLALFFIFPVTIPTGIVKGLFGGDFGILGVATCALWRRCTFFIVMMTFLAVLYELVGMLFVGEGGSLIPIRCIKPGILDGKRILLAEDTLQGEQGSEEHNRSDNGNEFLVHEIQPPFLFFFHTFRPNRINNNHVVKKKMDLELQTVIGEN